MTPFSITRRVEFGDTDMAGIMHFSNFFRFMEAAETAYLRERGLSVSWLEGNVKWGFPRRAVSCDYQKPARFQELLTVTVTLEKLGAKSVTYRFDFTNEQGEPLAVGLMTSVFCRSLAPDHIEALDIPDEMRAKIEGKP